MGTVEVVIVDVLHKHSVEVPLVDDDHVIKALLPDRANQPLGDRVGSWGPERCSDAGDVKLG
jgi:hypothetical protein